MKPAAVPFEIGLHARLRNPSYAAAYLTAAMEANKLEGWVAL